MLNKEQIFTHVRYLWKRNEYTDALEYVHGLLDDDPRDSFLSALLGACYLKTDQPDMAERFFIQAHVIADGAPLRTEFYTSWARLYLGQERFQQACDIAKEHIKYYPKDTIAYDDLTTIYLKQKKFSEAETNARKRIAISPRALAYSLLLAALQEKGDRAGIEQCKVDFSALFPHEPPLKMWQEKERERGTAISPARF